MQSDPLIMMGPHTTVREALGTDGGRAVVGEIFAAPPPVGMQQDALLELPVSVALSLVGVLPGQRDELVLRLGRVPRPAKQRDAAPFFPEAYGDDGAPPARVRSPELAIIRSMVEIVLEGPSHGNPFVQVELAAVFTHDSGRSIRNGGFYDGDGRYILRLIPDVAGRWTFRTESNARALDRLGGLFTVDEGSAPGVVRVEGAAGFAFEDGQAFVPLGTTAYAWTHQSAQLQEETLASLAAAPFNKVRMCVFPKAYAHNADDPELWPFEMGEKGFDHDRFEPAFFRHLERRIRDLDALGIQADLILFHPYDRWGFADMGTVADERYLRYVIRRLSAFPNVWWSMANEYDLIASKDVAEWHRLASIVREEDPFHHLHSIHNGIYPFDYSATWATHASLQRCESIRSTDMSTELLSRWGKPVVFDEMGYEGDLEAEWGNMPAFEVVRQFWEAAVAGAYVTHGETYWREDGAIFWAKGGRLVGESPARIGFLAGIIAESPSGRLDMVRTGLRGKTGGVEGLYELTYFGLAQPRTTTIVVPDGRRAQVDIIDTWEMTMESVQGELEGTIQVALPVRPYLAVRVRVSS